MTNVQQTGDAAVSRHHGPCLGPCCGMRNAVGVTRNLAKDSGASTPALVIEVPWFGRIFLDWYPGLFIHFA